MFNRINKFQFTLALLILAAMTAAIYKASTTQASGLTGMESVIVQLKDDPAAVYRAKIQKSGGSVSDQQLQSYRNGLRASQDQFLTALQARGVTFSIDSVDIKGFDGADDRTMRVMNRNGPNPNWDFVSGLVMQKS